MCVWGVSLNPYKPGREGYEVRWFVLQTRFLGTAFSPVSLRLGKGRKCLGEDTAFPHGTGYFVRFNETTREIVFGRKALLPWGADDVRGEQRSKPSLLWRQ